MLRVREGKKVMKRVFLSLFLPEKKMRKKRKKKLPPRERKSQKIKKRTSLTTLALGKIPGSLPPLFSPSLLFLFCSPLCASRAAFFSCAPSLLLSPMPFSRQSQNGPVANGRSKVRDSIASLRAGGRAPPTWT